MPFGDTQVSNCVKHSLGPAWRQSSMREFFIHLCDIPMGAGEGVGALRRFGPPEQLLYGQKSARRTGPSPERGRARARTESKRTCVRMIVHNL